MDSDEDESFDERPAALNDSTLTGRFQSWLTNFGASCRRQQANGPLSELHLYRNSVLGTSVDGRVPGSLGNCPGEQLCVVQHTCEMLSVVQAQGHPDEALDVVQVQGHPDEALDVAQVQGHPDEALDVVQVQGHPDEALDVAQVQGHPDKALDVAQAHRRAYEASDFVQDQGHPNEVLDGAQAQGHPTMPLHVSQALKHNCGAVAAIHALSYDAETQTTISLEGGKEVSDPGTATSSLPDVIYSSSESSAPTSPDVLSNGAFKEQEAGDHNPVDCKERSKQFCSEAETSDLSSGISDASLQQNASFSSSTGQPDSQRSDAGKEAARKFSSGYATQESRQSVDSRRTSCEDGTSVSSLTEGMKDGLSDPSAMSFMTDPSSSLENLSSAETVVNCEQSSQKDSDASFHHTGCEDGTSVFSHPEGVKSSLFDTSSMTDPRSSSVENVYSAGTVVNWKQPSQKDSDAIFLPDFDWLLSNEESKSISSDPVRGPIAETSGVLENVTMAIDNENVAAEIPVDVSQPVLDDASRMSEEMWNLEIQDPLLADYALQLISEGLTPVEVEQNLLEHLNKLSAQNFAADALLSGNLNEEEEDVAMDIWSWSDEVQRNCTRQLQIAASCGDKACGDETCLFFQELLGDLEDHLRNDTLLSTRLHLQLLRGIVEHSDVCSEIRCTMPWCFFFHRGDSDEPEEQISRLLTLFCAFDLGVTREIKATAQDNVQFIQLDMMIKWPSIESSSKPVPEPESDFEFLAPSAQFGQISFYALSPGIVPKFLFVEMHSAIDGTHVWNRMRGLQHPNLVHLFWVYVSRSQAVICSDAVTYGDKSLEDVMRENRTGLPRAEFVQFSAGILSATEYLNGNQILYLLWTADSVGVMSDGWTVRLRDFSCAIDESRATSDDSDIADILCSALPPIIVSPEMFESDVGRHCEVWGIGCLMFHLAHGVTVHHDLRHCDLDQARAKVQRTPFVSILRSCRNVPVRNILSQVFVEKSQRLQLLQLCEQVLQLQAS